MRPVLLAAVLLLGAPGVAGAAVLPGEYGGGGVVTPIAGSAPRVNAFAAVVEGSWVGISGRVSTPCGWAFGSGRARLAADGSFTVTSRRRERRRGIRRTQRVRFAGRLEGGAGAGTVSGTVILERRSGTTRRCGYGPLSWQLRRSESSSRVPAAPQPGAALYGLTDQRSSGLMHPVVIVVSPDATRVDAVVLSAVKHCYPARVLVLEHMTMPFPIRPDGTFRVRERFTDRYVDATERTRLEIKGRFVGDGVIGTLRARSVARRPGGRLIDRCRVSSESFFARP